MTSAGSFNSASVIILHQKKFFCLDSHCTEQAVCTVVVHLWGHGHEPLVPQQTKNPTMQGPHPILQAGLLGTTGQHSSCETPLILMPL